MCTAGPPPPEYRCGEYSVTDGPWRVGQPGGWSAIRGTTRQCSWTITCPRDRVPTVTFESFDLTYYDSLWYTNAPMVAIDVDVFDGRRSGSIAHFNPPDARNYGSHEVPEPVTSTSQTLELRLTDGRPLGRVNQIAGMQL
eukprot:SAG31_NODE_23663_length_499_cov_0.880000_1_plen_139_part_01